MAHRIPRAPRYVIRRLNMVGYKNRPRQSLQVEDCLVWSNESYRRFQPPYVIAQFCSSHVSDSAGMSAVDISPVAGIRSF
jgi:hypothetical protein